VAKKVHRHESAILFILLTSVRNGGRLVFLSPGKCSPAGYNKSP
jgi:hypothetical protein